VRNAIVFASLSVSLAGCATSQTQAVESQMRNVGARVVATIQAGGDLSNLGIFHGNYEHDPAPVAALRGCDYTILPASGEDELHLDWRCSDSANSTFTRISLPEGKLFHIEYQPSIRLMAPTQVGLASSQLSSKKNIRKRFQDAVFSGSDPSLGGLIPISTRQREQLAEMRGWVLFDEDGSGEYGAETFWHDKNLSSGADTTIHFDDAGRPIGLWLRQAPLRTTVTTTSVP
jgi:hypothetical protein